MIYASEAIQVEMVDDKFAKLTFNSANQSVNKFDQSTLRELNQAVTEIQATPNLQGLMITSAKASFLVGADITEFSQLFSVPEAQLIRKFCWVNDLFCAIEDLPLPTVSLINGLALGGGFEICLATDYRIMSTAARVGLPETKLGLYPGWGGTVRLPRLIGADKALDWICTGNDKTADIASRDGAVDSVVAPELLEHAGLSLLQRCFCGELDYRNKRAEKQAKISLQAIEEMVAFATTKGLAPKTGAHYPALAMAINTIQQHASMERDEALAIESTGFAKLAKSSVATNLIGLFLNDQYLKKNVKLLKPKALPVTQAAVLGAGIMGGGIAYQSALKGVPIHMKDIETPALQCGLDEAGKLLAKQVSRGRINKAKMAQVLSRIQPTLDYNNFDTVDLVVEAVVENPIVKKRVLAELETHVAADTVITSNTSTISINQLAGSLQEPSRFCGMHFFNPVALMPLVEIICGDQSSEATIATAVAFANQIGKKPVVVRDCPGFFVNRVLFPYFGGFNHLVDEGVDFRRIDRVMTAFGWPMGPAHLLDVIGIDTAHHAQAVLAEGFPERMAYAGNSAIDRLYQANRLGQKNSVGFYSYVADSKGRLQKANDDTVDKILPPRRDLIGKVSDTVIIQRIMIPMCLEVLRCLQENIIASPAEADLALVYGLGFPSFLGGACKYIDAIGLVEFYRQAELYHDISPLYQAPASLRSSASPDTTLYDIAIS